ncbi:LOW QUALITY PROTEIN: nephrocystin-3-like [Pecten maximus]|uniref:LOW QUALITY PROTEIN: nephrocystin-3-like n=1 Tax=Pecten maximus TaxID=6579 RepID=UPI0014589AC9|nr:LOW QUALITY PROTEIN: nephrocystin-3-like [Pecten maximus]
MATGGAAKPRKNSNSGQKSTVKIFITSFSDEFHSERDVIRKQVLPELRSWCESKQLTLVEHFVKWGSRHPERRDVSDQEKIQTSIESCYFHNVMPLFLNITSEALGWVPMWGEHSDDHIEDFIASYGLLVEDLEVMYGAYREDNHNSLFLMRQDEFLDKVPATEIKYFVRDTAASQKIKSSGDKISQKFPSSRVSKYKVQYTGLDQRKRPRVQFEDSFTQTVTEFCKQKIAYDFLGEQPQSSTREDSNTKLEHQFFMKNKGEFVLGRSDVIQKIEDYIFRDEKDVPLLILGGQGYGKSSILCKAATVIEKKVQEEQIQSTSGQKWHVFFHFVGAAPGSTCLEAMLKRLLREMEVINDSNIPRGIESTAQMCCSMLSNPNTRPVIIFIDALNQFAEEQAALVMSWLPRKLAPRVRCVFSTIENTPQHKTLIARETKPILLEISPLDMESRQKIVTELLKKYNRCLSTSQLGRLMAKQTSENPLWLTVACEEIRLLDDLCDVDRKIAELPESLLSLLEYLLTRLETEAGGNLVVATLCLLEASSAGLLESELRQILGQEATLMPPSPFDEKEEKESSEKESAKSVGPLPDKKWTKVFSTLQPFLRPYGDNREGRLDFYHRALSKAVIKRYLQKSDEEKANGQEKSDSYYWWHKKLADHFQHMDNVDRYVEEYPCQLVCLDDSYRLAQCLCDWRIFDQLYHEEFSSRLLAYWRKVGSASEMITYYEKALTRFEEDDTVNEENVSIRYEKVCRVVIQAGKYLEALELLRTAMKIEEKELGARPHRMVELYALMAEIYDEKLKLNDFVSPSQLPDLRKTIHYGRKSIALRKKLPGTYHKFKLGMSLMKLAFNMESWEACGGGPELTGEAALAEGNKYIDKALKIFEELNDMGHYAEALMTKGVLARRGSMEQLKLYNEAMDLCMQMYGEYHILTSRLYINIGIVYEDNNDFKKAYEYFKKWARVSEEILGPDHPKTQRAKGVLRESRYQRIARTLGENDDDHDEDRDEDTNEDEEEMENPDVEHYYDDQISQGVGQQIQLDNSLLETLNPAEINTEEAENQRNLGHAHPNNVLTPINNADTIEQLMNGYYEGNEDEDENGSGSNHENSDNENFYDDNFEDYEEHYILHSDSGPVIEEFNVNLEDEDDEEDEEIVQITARDSYNNDLEQDNRYAGDSREGSDDDS